MHVTAELLFDGVKVDEQSGDVPNVFASATLLLGQRSGTAPNPSRYAYDEVDVVRDGAGLLGNPGFENPLLAQSGSSTAEAWGNWRGYSQAGGTTVRSAAAPVFAGTYSGKTTITTNGGYLLQDVAVASGDVFEIGGQVFPDYGDQGLALLFDWDRDEGAVSGIAFVDFTAAGTTWNAWNLAGNVDPIPFDEWTNVVLRLSTDDAGWSIGQVPI